MFIYAFTLIAAALGSILYCASLPLTSWSQIWIPFVAFGVCYAAALAAAFLCIIAVGLTINPKRRYEKQSKFYYNFLNEGYRFLCCLAIIKIHVRGAEKLPRDVRFLMVCNHRSNFDNMVQSCSLRDFPISYVSKPENFKIPVAKRFMFRSCYLSIDRQDARKAIATINKAAELISSGSVCIGIFPEGHRVKGSVLDEFHAGSFKIAQKARCPVVVTALEGMQNIRRNFPFRSTHVYFSIIRVIPYEEIKDKRTSELSEEVRNEIQAFLDSGAGS